MKRIAFLTLLVGLLLVELSGVRTLALPPAQATQTVTLTTDQEVSVGYNADLDEKVAYDSTEDGLRFGNYVAPAPHPGRSYFRTYLHFSLGSLPANATVQQATLSLYVFDRRFPEGGDLDAGAYRVTTDGWTEVGLKDTTSWSWDTLPTFLSTPEMTTTVSAMEQWYSWDVTALVQAWHGGSAHNYGVMLSGDPEGGVAQAVGARSRAGAMPDLGPRLVVTYTLPPTPTPQPPHIPGEIPEPSTLALMGGGLLALWVAIRSRARRH